MTKATRKRLLVVQVAGLSEAIARELKVDGLQWRAMDSVFPAVTCTVQASFRTASAPSAHGMIANGLYDRRLRRAMFWEQSSGLVEGERIWTAARAAGKRVGMLFWQQSLGEDVDVVLSPAPIHKHHGGMIQDCYSRPNDLYTRLCKQIGRPFKLRQYWGPAASAKVGDWIAEATAAVMADADLGVDVCLTYLPTLDYDLQRYGNTHKRTRGAIERLRGQLDRIVEAAKPQAVDVVVFGDYAIADVTGPVVFPNRVLAEAGLLAVRRVEGMLYPDFHTSRALAVVDHEVAHVYVRDESDVDAVEAVFRELPGVAEVLKGGSQAAGGLDHANSGELVLVAEPGSWLAYPWWTEPREVPDYARHVDIHNKPGFDPCELFWSWWPPGISQDVSHIRGSHGRVGVGREVAWASTTDLGEVGDVIELGRAVKQYLDTA